MEISASTSEVVVRLVAVGPPAAAIGRALRPRSSECVLRCRPPANCRFSASSMAWFSASRMAFRSPDARSFVISSVADARHQHRVRVASPPTAHGRSTRFRRHSRPRLDHPGCWSIPGSSSCADGSAGGSFVPVALIAFAPVKISVVAHVKSFVVWFGVVVKIRSQRASAALGVSVPPAFRLTRPP